MQIITTQDPSVSISSVPSECTVSSWIQELSEAEHQVYLLPWLELGLLPNLHGHGHGFPCSQRIQLVQSLHKTMTKCSQNKLTCPP